MRGWLSFFICGLLWGALCALPASAHPLGNFTINHLAKVRLQTRGLSVRYIVDMAEIPTFQVMAQRVIAAAEPERSAGLAGWGADEAALMIHGLRITADGINLKLSAARPRVVTRPGAGGLPTLYFVDDLRAQYPNGKAPRAIAIVDDNYAERIGWKDIIVAPQTEPTHELRSYPSALLGSPRSIQQVSVKFGTDGRVIAVSGLATPVLAPAGNSSQTRSNLLSDLLARGSSSAALIVLTLLVAAGLGALHALEPGHGKTLLAVSLVGARATVKQAFVLATALTVAHTAGVIALGIALLAFARFIVPEMVYPWIALGSGACVAMLGASALARQVRQMRGATHAREHAQGHMHDAGAHVHGHTHEVPPLPSGAPLSFRNVVLVAMSGNVAPCPAALVVLLTALSLHRLGYGMLVVIAFSIGLAAVLTGLGIAVVRGAAWLGERRSFERVVRYGPLATACIICTIGIVMLAQAASTAVQISVWSVGALSALAIAGFALAPGHTHTHTPADAGQHLSEETT